MQTESIQLNNGQYIGEVLKDIPTNTILDKTICGCGATTLEIATPRHSIIIEPNLPVILGKQDGHPDMLGVYEAVTVPKVEEYLQEYANSYEPLINTEGKIRYELPKKIYYKIMTTPEGFHKVKTAINNSGMNLYQDFFLLFDECEKASQDVDYRNSILNPIDDFFLCNNKAMVSATPIIVNDPRFEQQEFKKIKVAPTYDYRQPLSLVITTNVNNILDNILRKLPQHLKACIFFNTTEGIKEVVEQMHLKGQSNIFCGAESRSKLVKENIQSVYTNLVKIDGKIQLERYNFFTSRFFSAVDIILDNLMCFKVCVADVAGQDILRLFFCHKAERCGFFVTRLNFQHGKVDTALVYSCRCTCLEADKLHTVFLKAVRQLAGGVVAVRTA